MRGIFALLCLFLSLSLPPARDADELLIPVPPPSSLLSLRQLDAGPPTSSTEEVLPQKEVSAQ